MKRTGLNQKRKKRAAATEQKKAKEAAKQWTKKQEVKAKAQAAAATKQTRQQVRQKVKKTLPSSCYKRMWGRWAQVNDFSRSWRKQVGCSINQWDMEIKQRRDLGDTTRTHFHGCWKIRDKTWSWIMVNKKWRKRVNWTDYINERAMSTSITVNKQRVLLMSV